MKGLLYSNDPDDDRSYRPDGRDVVAELHGTIVGVAEFQRPVGFGHAEGRETLPGMQTFVHTMAVADV